jgi:hypothetical protein
MAHEAAYAGREADVHRRYAEYRPSRPFRVRPRLFHSRRLNVAGWSAVSGLLLAGAALGYGAAGFAGLPRAGGALTGVAAALAALITVDRRRAARLGHSKRRG